MYSNDKYFLLGMVVHASAGHENWYICPTVSVTCGPHTAKSACMCSGVESGWKGAALSWKDRKHGLSCTILHVLKVCIQGRTNREKVSLDFLRPRTDAARSGMRGMSCTELCAVAPKRSYYVMWLLSLSRLLSHAAGKQIATLHKLFFVRQHRAQCSSFPSFLSVLHPFAALEF